MANEINVPEKLRGPFRRLMRRLPEILRHDEHVQKTTLVLLQLGGEKLARARIKAYQTPFSEAFVFKKMQLKNEDLIELPVPESDIPEEDGESEIEGDDEIEDV